MMKRNALALVTFACCACVARTPADERLVDSSWTFVSIDEMEPVRPAGARLTITAESLSATVGCNGMGGAWKIEGERLIAGPLAGTKKYCAGPIWDQEQALSSLLVAAPKLELDGDRLTLRSSGHSAELRRVAARQD